MQHPMTPRMRALKSFIASYTDEHGIAPKVDEMREHLGLASKGGVVRLIDGLVDRGHLSRLPNKARSCRVLTKAEGDRVTSTIDDQSVEGLLRRAYYIGLVRSAMPLTLRREIEDFLKRNP